MSSPVKNAILWAYIEDVLTQIMVQTNADNVLVDQNTTLVAKLSEMVAAINARAKSTDVTAEIKAAIDNLIDGAPGTYDTLKEMADYISAHEDVVDGINAAIGSKAERSVVDAIKATVDALGSLAKKSVVSENDLDAALREKVNAAAQGNHSHGNKAILDSITAAKVSEWDGKTRVRVNATQPADLKKTDLWIQPI